MEAPLSVLLALGLAPWALTATPAPGAAPPPAPPQEAETSVQDEDEPEVLPDFDLEGFRQTKAETFGDYAGRLVLIEFFEHW